MLIRAVSVKDGNTEAQNGEEAASELPAPPPFDGVMPQMELYERQDNSIEASEEHINDAELPSILFKCFE